MVSDEETVQDDEVSQVSELERAEMILKEKQREKRRLKQLGILNDGGKPKRRRIMMLDSDSD